MDDTAEERQEEKRFLADMLNWPCYPLLPVKRRGSPDIGVVFASAEFRDDGPITVYLVNMFGLTALADEHRAENNLGPEDPVTYGDILNRVETVEFPDLDSFLDAGWVGD
jgi:hypothetical protein